MLVLDVIAIFGIAVGAMLLMVVVIVKIIIIITDIVIVKIDAGTVRVCLIPGSRRGSAVSISTVT